MLLASSQAIATEELKTTADKALDKFLRFKEIPGLDFVATKDKKRGTAAIALSRDTSLFKLSIEGELSGDKNTAGEFADLKVIGSDAKIEFGWSKMFIEHVTQNNLGKSKEIAAQVVLIDAARVALKLCKSLAKSSDNADKDVCKAKQELLDDTIKLTPLDSTVNPLTDFNYASFSVGYGNSDFSYFSLAENKNKDSTEESYSLTASYGGINANALSRWEFGLSYQEGYEVGSGNKEQNICRGIPDNTDYTQCFNALLKRPIKKTALVPFVSYSQNFDEHNVIKGIKVKLSYIKEDNEKREDGSIEETDRWGVELPVYLYSSDDGKYSGGIEFGYNSKPTGKDNNLSVAFFFRASLNVFK